ncbi:MAG TPA: hypothetical protein VGN55_05500 [Xanthobacteraceae bacterium]
MVLVIAIGTALMILVMALHENDVVTVPVLVMVAMKDDDMAIPILVVFPVTDDGDVAVAIAVVISVTEMYGYAPVLRHDHRLFAAVGRRECRYREKGDRSHRQSQCLHGASPEVVWTSGTKRPRFGSRDTYAQLSTAFRKPLPARWFRKPVVAAHPAQ